MLGQKFNHLPEVVKNLLIINGLFFLSTWALQNQGIDLTNLFALHQFQSPDFKPHQLVTHMFMHGDFSHLLVNMIALYFFGKTLENMWGGKRFLIYYMITGFGAALIYMGYIQFQIYEIANEFPEYLEAAKNGNYVGRRELGKFIPHIQSWNIYHLVHTPMVGASGAVFGLLLAFGMLFPNTQLVLLFPPIPIKAKYLVIGYGALELLLGMQNNPADNVAHFAHLGGMIFGFIVLKIWKRNRNSFY